MSVRAREVRGRGCDALGSCIASAPCPHSRATEVADGEEQRGWVPLWLRFLPSSVLTFHIYEQARRLLLGSYLD